MCLSKLILDHFEFATGWPSPVKIWKHLRDHLEKWEYVIADDLNAYVSVSFQDSSSKNEHSAIIYLPTCHSNEDLYQDKKKKLHNLYWFLCIIKTSP